MGKEELYTAFEELFPDWAKKATSYKKIGSKCLAIRFNNGTSRVFLFENPNNWHFGTKLWRRRPVIKKNGNKSTYIIGFERGDE